MLEIGVLERRFPENHILIGIIEKEHVSKKARHLRKYRVLHKSVSIKACSRCDIRVNIIMNIILPHNYNPEPGTFFVLKLPAVENQPEIIPEVIPGRLTYRDNEIETAVSIQDVESILLQRRTNRRSSKLVFNENIVSTNESTDGELSDSISDDSNNILYKFNVELDSNIKKDYEKKLYDYTHKFCILV